jgi:hypothetical protein
MADEADYAEELQEAVRVAAVNTARNVVQELNKKGVHGPGHCLYCSCKVDPIKYNGKMVTPRWCVGTRCRDLWERDQ